MTKQKLRANFNCCLITVNNQATYISLSQSIKQQVFAIASKLSISVRKVIEGNLKLNWLEVVSFFISSVYKWQIQENYLFVTYKI